jgi:hypothetical protein
MSFLSLLPGDLKQQLQRERMKAVFTELLDTTKDLAHCSFLFNLPLKMHIRPFYQVSNLSTLGFKENRYYWSYFHYTWLESRNEIKVMDEWIIGRSKTLISKYVNRTTNDLDILSNQLHCIFAT